MWSNSSGATLAVPDGDTPTIKERSLYQRAEALNKTLAPKSTPSRRPEAEAVFRK
ncbi:unnamed protein product [Knipowitschia caucasica]